MGATECRKHEELLDEAQSILQKIHELAARQRDLVGRDGVSNRFIHFDKELEQLMGEKERAVGALLEHDKEHGCQN